MQPSDTSRLSGSTANAFGDRARTIARIVVALFVILGGGELLVRSFIGGPSAQVYDPGIGYSYLPGGEMFQAKEGFARLRLNALGMNDEDIGPKNGRCRVLVIGDSYTAALQVPREQNFTSVAETLDRRLDVLNAGRDGLFLGDLHKVRARLAPQVQADLVVYVISQRAVEADIRLPDFSVMVDPETGVVKDALMRVEEKEELKQTFAPLLRNSALATRLASQLQPSVVGAQQELGAWRNRFSPNPAPAASRGPAAVASASNEDILSFMFRRLAQDSPTALLYINALQYKPGRRAFVGPSSGAAEVVARRAAARAGVRFYATSEYLIESVERTGQPPYGFGNALLPGGHLNAAGHRAVGAALAALVRDMSPALASECGGR